MSVDIQRAAFKAWLQKNNLSPFAAAKLAGISPGTIYNYLSGVSSSLSSGVLQKLATSTGNPVDAILTGDGPIMPIRVAYRVGALGKMFPTDDDENLTVSRPPGISSSEDVAAAIIEGDALLPIPSGWAVFFRLRPEPADTLVGQMAVVRFNGGGDKPYVRTIRRGSTAGLFTLQAFNGGVTEDVEVAAAHRIISFAKPE